MLPVTPRIEKLIRWSASARPDRLLFDDIDPRSRSYFRAVEVLDLIAYDVSKIVAQIIAKPVRYLGMFAVIFIAIQDARAAAIEARNVRITVFRQTGNFLLAAGTPHGDESLEELGQCAKRMHIVVLIVQSERYPQLTRFVPYLLKAKSA